MADGSISLSLSPLILTCSCRSVLDQTRVRPLDQSCRNHIIGHLARSMHEADYDLPDWLCKPREPAIIAIISGEEPETSCVASQADWSNSAVAPYLCRQQRHFAQNRALLRAAPPFESSRQVMHCDLPGFFANRASTTSCKAAGLMPNRSAFGRRSCKSTLLVVYTVRGCCERARQC